jgi:hypothetical protein
LRRAVLPFGQRPQRRVRSCPEWTRGSMTATRPWPPRSRPRWCARGWSCCWSSRYSGWPCSAGGPGAADRPGGRRPGRARRARRARARPIPAGAGTARTPDPVRPAGRGGLPGLDPRSRGAPGPGLSRPGGGRTGAPGALRVAARAPRPPVGLNVPAAAAPPRRPPLGISGPAAAPRPGRQSSSSQAGRRRAAGGIIRGW